jgi:Fe-S cluster biosynthesis and repair protein YggX
MAASIKLELANASKDKWQKWSKLQTEHLEELLHSMNAKLRNVPESQWTEWDKHSIEILKGIIGERRADEVRKDIARMMKLAGIHYGIEKNKFWRAKGRNKNQ